MSVFDDIKDSVAVNFSDWIKIDDSKSKWTIEDFPYNQGVDENVTKPHCWKCVTVNQCWFKNEDGKKPEEFDYSKYTYNQISHSTRGLYHPHCHCKKKSINVPRIKDIELIGFQKKFNDFFKRKSNWYYSWGYKNKDKNQFLEALKESTKLAFRYGNYEIEKHTKTGFQINIFVTINGANEKRFKDYLLKTCYIVFPKGKLRLITLAGGWK